MNWKTVLNQKDAAILKEILNTGDIEDYAREQYQEKNWKLDKWRRFNHIRRLVGLPDLEPYEEEEEDPCDSCDEPDCSGCARFLRGIPGPP